MLVIYARDGAVYGWPRCASVRQAKRELRWTNIQGEKRTMALAFIHAWHATEETDMAATFHLTDGTTINDVTTYAEVHTPAVTERVGMGPIFSVFTTDGRHRYVPVAQVDRIETWPSTVRPKAWHDLPMAAGMWAADGADLRV